MGDSTINVASAAQHHLPISTGGSDMDKLYQFLGPPTGQVHQSAYEKTPFQNYDLPEAYKGRNLFLRDTIDGFIMEPNEWYTGIALPWSQTEEIHIHWNEWKFNTTLADRVPHEGISRLVTSSKRENVTHSVRRGLAFVLEGDFYNTPEGAIQYQRNIRGIAQCVQETSNHDTIFALLTCKKNAQIWEEKFGRMKTSVTAIVEEEINNYGIIAFDKYGLDIVFEEALRLLSKQGVRDNVIFIMSPGSKIYLSMVESSDAQFTGPGHKARFFAMGDKGVDMEEQGPRSVGIYRGIAPVYETRDFDVYADEPPVQLLTRAIQIGERYVMSNELYNDMTFTRGDDLNNPGSYRSHYRDIYIYNENQDAFNKISFRDAIKHCHLFNDEGKVSDDAERHAREHKENLKSGIRTQMVPFFLTKLDDGSYKPLDYFGDMMPENASIDTFRSMGRTMFAGIINNKDYRTYDEMIAFIHEIDQQPYDETFFQELIKQNYNNGVTEGTDRVDNWDTKANGALTLPAKNLSTLTYPPGYGNMPGLKEIAAHADSKDDWSGLGVKAKKYVQLIEKMASHIRATFGEHHPVIDEANVSPWFKPDHETALFENIVGGQRAPLFIRRPTQKTKDETDYMIKSRKMDINYKVLPLFGVSTNSKDVNAIKRYLATQKETGVVDQEFLTIETDKESRPFTSGQAFEVLINGTTFDVETKYLLSSAILSRDLKLYALMGKSSLPALNRVYIKVMDEDNYQPPQNVLEHRMENKKKLSTFLFRFATDNYVSVLNLDDDGKKASNGKIALRQIVLGLDTKTPMDLINLINPLTQGTGTGKKKIIKDLIAPAKFVTDYDLDNFTDDRLEAPAFRFSGQKPGNIGAKYAEISDLMTNVMDQVIEANYLRSKYVPTNSLVTRFGFSEEMRTRWLSASGPDSSKASPGEMIRYNELLSQISATSEKMEKLVDATFKDSSDLKKWEKAIDSLYPGFESQSTNIKAHGYAELSENALAYGRFVRSPLTGSIVLIDKLQELSGAELRPKSLLVMPGDDSQGHTSPLKDIAEGLKNQINFYHSIISLAYGGAKQLSLTPFAKNIGNSLRTDSRATQKHRRRRHAGFGKRSYEDSSSESDFGDKRKKSYAKIFEDDSDSDVIDMKISSKMNIGARNPSGFSFSTGFSSAFKSMWDNIMNFGGNALEKAETLVASITKFDAHSVDIMIEKHMNVPINIILWRLFIEHDMSTFILMRPGLETGGNLYGHSNFVVGNDVISKLIYGNFTFYSKAVVWKERNVFLMENVKPDGYRGGMNVRFIMGRRDIEEAQQRNRDRPSIIATAVSTKEHEGTLKPVMSFTGMLPISDVNTDIDGDQEIHYSTATFYESIYHLGDRVDARKNMESEGYFDRENGINVVALQGHQWNYDTSSGRYSVVTECKGHRKRDGNGVGAARVWNGKKAFFEKQEWQNYVLK